MTREYALVTYDADGLVVEHEQDLACDPSVFDDAADRPDLLDRLLSGDLRFTADQDESEVSFSVSARQRDEYRGAHSLGDGCAILLGCESAARPVRIAIDGREQASMPNLARSFHDTPQLEEVSPGPHRFEISPAITHLKFQAASECDCAAGEIQYGLIRREPGQPAAWFSATWSANVTVSAEMPETFRERRLLIWGNGRWLVATEPGQ
jgi:hypothetical protein